MNTKESPDDTLAGGRAYWLSRRELFRVAGFGLAGAGAAALIGCGSDEDSPTPLPASGTALPPPEVTKVRLPGFDGSSLCLAPLLLAQDYLPAEGIEAEYVMSAASDPWPERVDDGTFDLCQDFIASTIIGADQGLKVTFLGGTHVGCLQLFAREDVTDIASLAGKKIAVPFGDTATNPDYAFMVTLMDFVGLPDDRVVVSFDADKLASLLRTGEIDAVLAYEPLGERLRDAEGIHILLSTADDPPFSNYYCCVFFGNTDFVNNHPVATFRTLRALYHATDLIGRDPEAASRRLVDLGSPLDYEGTLHMVSHLPYDVWRTMGPEDAIRFYSLRLRDVGEISAAPEQIIEHADWRFLERLKEEMVFAPGDPNNPFALSCDVRPGPAGPSIRARTAPRWLRGRDI